MKTQTDSKTKTECTHCPKNRSRSLAGFLTFDFPKKRLLLLSPTVPKFMIQGPEPAAKDPKPNTVRNIREYPSGLIVCFDQDLKRIDDYYGPRETILPKLREEDLSKAVIKRMARTGKGCQTQWVEVTKQKFFFSK